MTKKPDDEQAAAERRAFNATNAQPPEKTADKTLSLRDMFAMAALVSEPNVSAEDAYRKADEMMKAREQ